MASIDDLYIRILADGSQLGAGLNSAQGKLDTFGVGMNKLGGILAGAFSVVAIERFISKSIDAADESARATAKVAQAIKTTAGVAGQSLQGLQAEAAKIQGFTLFEDDTVMNDVTAQLLTFSNIAEDTFKRAQMAALDLNTVLANGEGLTGTAIQLGKALNDPLKGITALQRSGVSFTPVQRELIKNFVETNQLGKAQNLILQEIERQYGGQARAAAEASNGVAQFKNSLNDAMESIGGAILKSSDLKQVLGSLGYTLNVAFDENIKGSSLIALIDGLTGGTYGKDLVERRRSLVDAMSQYEDMENRMKGQGKTQTGGTTTKSNTYADLKAELKSYQDELEGAQRSEMAGINKKIEAKKKEIQQWEQSGVAVGQYKGSIKGLQMELDMLNTKRDSAIGTANIAAVNEQISKKEEEIRVLQNASLAWVAYGAAATQSMTTMAAKSSLLDAPKTKLADNSAWFDAEYSKNETKLSKAKAFSDATNAVIVNGIANAITNMTEAAITGGDIGNAMLGSFGSMLSQLGQLVLTEGLGILAARVALQSGNPFVAIAAGISLIAVGAAFSKGTKSLGNSMGSGGGGSGGYGSSGNGMSDVGGGASPVRVEISGTLVARGNDLVTVFDNTNYTTKRTR